ncbi:MAG: hypothetical protein WDM91_20770 [Rhizomicrobium sp.]
MRLRTLIRLWIWTTLLAFAAFAVLGTLEGRLKSATGFGVLDLQAARDAFAYKRVLAAWIARGHAATAGFSLGFDYLFMALYAMAFYFSAMVAREAFTPKRGTARRFMDYLGYVPFVAAIADAYENAVELSQLTGTPDDGSAASAFLATNIKWVCFAVGVALLAAAIAGVIKLWWPKKEEEQ